MLTCNFRIRLGQIITANFLFIICVTVNTFAQGNASVSGSIKDQNEAVVVGATVTLYNSSTEQRRIATTDENGKYEFKEVLPGPTILIVRQNGFSDASKQINIASGQNLEENFSISLGSLSAEVTVTAAKGLRAVAEIPQTVTVVSEDEIENRRPVGIGEAYEKSPSVLSTDPNPFRTRPQIRGLQSNRILVTVDGERLNNPRFGADFVGVSPSLVDTSQVASVEVVAGSASSLYGSDAVGGAINIVTKGPEKSLDGTRFDFKFDGDYASNNSYRKGVITLGVGGKYAAIRGSFGRFISPNYHLGGESVSRQEVVEFGQFASQAGLFAGQPLVSSYPVYDITAGQEVPFSGARGNIASLDFMLYPDDKQDVRIRFTNNDYSDLGVPFTGPIYTTNQAETGLSTLRKFSGRYERREIASWFPRLSASAYWQDYERSLEEVRFNIRNGSSYATNFMTFQQTFTGNTSIFDKSGESSTTNRNTGSGFDVQFTFLPTNKVVYITGLNFSNDFSRDDFSNTQFSTMTGAVIGGVSNAANTPRTTYRNFGWYNQLEYAPNKYVRLSGGFRYDNWKTKAEPTTGFPSGVIGDVFLATLPLIQANPGPLDAVGAAGYAILASGQEVTTKSNVGTYNVAALFLIPGGINPFIRYSTSFREPDIIGRYLFRNFTTAPFFSLPSIINTNLEPEKGKDIDVGIKVSRKKVRGTFSFYRNQIDNATGTVLNAYCINPIGIAGITPTPPGFGCPPPPAPPTHLVQVFQSVNFSEIVIKGTELSAEADVSLGDAGSLTPYFTFSTIKATNNTPDASRIAIVQNLYNSSAPLKLDGSVDDVPFYALPNYQGSFSPRFTSAKGNWWAEYEYRFTSDITRVDPNEISFAGVTSYANFASYKGLNKHSIRGGFRFGEKYPVRVTMGVENLTNELYFTLFQPAPAQGRSFTIGTTIEFSRLFNN